jgi:hypothetical protein
VINFSEASTGEEYDVSDEETPMSPWLQSSDSPVYQEFLARDQTLPPLVPILPQFSVVEVAAPVQSTILEFARPFIHLQAPSTIVQKHKNRFIHSWCDLSGSVNVDAKRAITSFFNDGYQGLDPGRGHTAPHCAWIRGNVRAPPPANNNSPFSQRIRIFHYVGLGAPAPTADKIHYFGQWTLLRSIEAVHPPSFSIFDCSHAAILRKPLVAMETACRTPVAALFACSESEQLLIPPDLPQNFLSCVLLCPLKTYAEVVCIKIATTEENCVAFDRLLSTFAKAIAFDTLSRQVFARLFRGGPIASSLWSRFLLAQRLMRQFGIHPQSLPDLPDLSDHPLWAQFDAFATGIVSRSPIATVSAMYCQHFSRVPTPSRHSRIMMSLLMDAQEDHSVILAAIARFMQGSPANCRAFADCLDISQLAPYSCARSKSKDYFRDWLTVLSGLFLGAPSIARRYPSKPGEVIDFAEAPDSPHSAALLLSLMTAINDSRDRVSYCLSGQVLRPWLPLLFHRSTHPLVREWITINIHATIIRHTIDVQEHADSNLPAYAALLLLDGSRYARAAAVSILSHLMMANYREFNASLMHTAMRAAVDGSALVRLAFAHCLSRYMALHGPTTDERYSLEFFLRSPLDQPAGYPNTEQLVEILANDPALDVRAVARSAPNAAPEWDGTEIHRLAHLALFSQDQTCEENPRYDGSLFLANDLDLLETIRKSDAKIVVVEIFEGIVCFGTTRGEVGWGRSTWKLDSSAVKSICHIAQGRLLAATATSVYMVVRGSDRWVECFTPGCDIASICRLPRSSIVSILRKRQLTLWNFATLLIERESELPDDGIALATVGDSMFCLMRNGTIIKVAKDGLSIEAEVPAPSSRLAMIGEHDRVLYASGPGGAWVWKNNLWLEWQSVPNIEEVVLHRTLHRALARRASEVIVIEIGMKLQAFATAIPTCVCWDEEQPMCAVGHRDGTIAVWRVPI